MLYPFCVTQTPKCYKIAFPYHPTLKDLVHRIPSVARNPKAAYIPDERAWKVSLEDKWYVDKMGEWAVSARICSRVQRSVSSRAVTDYTIPDMTATTST